MILTSRAFSGWYARTASSTIRSAFSCFSDSLSLEGVLHVRKVCSQLIDKEARLLPPTGSESNGRDTEREFIARFTRMLVGTKKKRTERDRHQLNQHLRRHNVVCSLLREPDVVD